MNRSCRSPRPADRLLEAPRSHPVAVTLVVAACVFCGLPAAIQAGSSPESLSAEDSQSGNEPDLTPLVAQLKHPSPARRCAALVRLSDAPSPPESLQSFVWPLLSDSDLLVRAQAARFIWRVSNRGDVATATLKGLLDPLQPQACACAMFLLGEMGVAAEDALPALRARMGDNDPLLRLHAAEAIVKIDPTDAGAHSTLTAALQETAPDVRYFAACALLAAGNRYRESVRGALLEALSDDDLRVASAAALSLENRPAGEHEEQSEPLDPSDEEASLAPELDRLVANLADPNAAVRRRAAQRLAELEATSGLVVRSLEEGLDDEDPLVRAYSASALWRIDRQPEVVLPVLIELLGTVRPNVTTLAISVLAQLGPAAADALPTLYDLMETGDPMIRLHVAIAISRIDPRGREAIGVLAAATHDADSDVRYLGTLSLGHVSLPLRKLAERELAGALGDRNLRVRAAAALSLDHLDAASVRAQYEIDTAEPARVRSARSTEAAHADFSATDDAETIPVLDERPAPESATPGSRTADEFDVDDVTVEERKTIGELRARITPSEGDLPADHAATLFAMAEVQYHGYGTARGWNGSSFAWANTGLCFRPLYFQDINLERVGYHYGCAQTLVSAIKFAADAALLPYKVVAENPHECVYTLGYDRAGNCIPYRCYRMPWRTDAAMVLGGVAVGLIFLAPP